MSSFGEYARDTLDPYALELAESDDYDGAKTIIELAEAMDRRQTQLDARDFDGRAAALDYVRRLERIGEYVRATLTNNPPGSHLHTLGIRLLDIAEGNRD